MIAIEHAFDKTPWLLSAPLRYAPGMPNDAGKSVLLRMLEMFATGDVQGASETVADDYRTHQAAAGLTARGPQAFRDLVRATRRPFADLDVWPEALVQNGDQVTARLHWRGVLPSGATLDRITVEVLRVVNGRAVEHWTEQVESRLSPAKGLR